jgi:hypothetical protein
MQHLWSALTILFLVVQSPATSKQTESSSTSKPPTLAQVWTLDATYSDPAHGVTFRYPSVWQATSQFAYWPPALKDSFAPPIAGFAHDEGGFPRDQIIGPYSATNLEGFGIVYSAIKAASAANATEWPPHSHTALDITQLPSEAVPFRFTKLERVACRSRFRAASTPHMPIILVIFSRQVWLWHR